MIILASESPRRRELLEMCKVDFDVMSSKIDEDKIIFDIKSKHLDIDNYELAKKITENLAYEKAKYIFDKNNDSIVIGSDTVVVTQDDGILGKPKSNEDAKQMLYSLSGKIHRVYTGVSIISNKHTEIFSTYTEVEFYELDEIMKNIISEYIEIGSPMDKAGSYGIQDMGGLLVKEIKGDYYTVMGLPIAETYRVLKKYVNSINDIV